MGNVHNAPKLPQPRLANVYECMNYLFECAGSQLQGTRREYRTGRAGRQDERHRGRGGLPRTQLIPLDTARILLDLFCPRPTFSSSTPDHRCAAATRAPAAQTTDPASIQLRPGQSSDGNAGHGLHPGQEPGELAARSPQHLHSSEYGGGGSPGAAAARSEALPARRRRPRNAYGRRSPLGVDAPRILLDAALHLIEPLHATP